jgi:ribosomal protein S27AE
MTETRFCPNCGSTWVEPDTSNRAEVFFSGGNPNKWACNNCGYTGLMPEGDPKQDYDEDQEEIEFEPDEDYPREDTGFGKGYLKYLIYISLPTLLAYFIYISLTQ